MDALKSVAPTPRETVLENLKKFTNYTIRVYAFTSNGNGISSEPVSLKTQEDGKLISGSSLVKRSYEMAENQYYQSNR